MPYGVMNGILLVLIALFLEVWAQDKHERTPFIVRVWINWVGLSLIYFIISAAVALLYLIF